MKNILVALLIAFLCSAANAQFVEGTQLHEWILANDRLDNGGKNQVDFINSSTVMFYIAGIAESYRNLGILCLPNGVSIGQMTSVVGKYLKEHPERWNERANILVISALTNAFPCKK
jgi:hypothetical protein